MVYNRFYGSFHSLLRPSYWWSQAFLVGGFRKQGWFLVLLGIWKRGVFFFFFFSLRTSLPLMLHSSSVSASLATSSPLMGSVNSHLVTLSVISLKDNPICQSVSIFLWCWGRDSYHLFENWNPARVKNARVIMAERFLWLLILALKYMRQILWACHTKFLSVLALDIRA